MKLKHAINWKTLLLASLVLNVALLAAWARIVTQLEQLQEQAMSPEGHNLVTNSAPAIVSRAAATPHAVAAVAPRPGPQ